MKMIVLGGVLVSSALALAGCGQAETANNGSAPSATASGLSDSSRNNAAGGTAVDDGSPQPARPGAQQDFALVNNTGRTLVSLNVSPSDTSQWGPDILGSATVVNGASGTVEFARNQEQCLWDLRATFDDGETGDWRGVNLCETTTITLTPPE
jgi:hypothetical protein